jgi:hypothetical protein
MKDDKDVKTNPDPVAFNDYDYEDESDEDNKEQKIYNTTIINNETNSIINESIFNEILNEQKKNHQVVTYLLNIILNKKPEQVKQEIQAEETSSSKQENDFQLDIEPNRGEKEEEK